MRYVDRVSRKTAHALRVVLAASSALILQSAAWTIPAGAEAEATDSDAVATQAILAGSSGTLTLTEVVSNGLSSGFDARIASLEASRAQDALSARWGGTYYPDLSIFAQGGYTNRLNERFQAIDGNGILKTYGLSNLGNDPWVSVVVEQILVDLRQWKQVEREELSARAAQLAEADKREVIALAMVRRYARVLELEELLGAAGEYVENARRLDDQAASLVAAGRTLKAGRDRVAIYLEEGELMVASLEGDLADARRALWIGMGGSGPAPLDWESLTLSALPQVSREAFPGDIDSVIRAAPDVQMLELQTQIQQANVSAAQAKRYPTLQLRGGYSNFGIKRFDNFTDEVFVFVAMEVPLFDGFETRSEIAGARKAVDQASLRYQSRIEAKRARVVELKRRVDTMGRRSDLATRRAEAAFKQREFGDLNLRAQRGNLDAALVDHQRTVIDVNDAIATRFLHFETWAMLQREMGRLVATLVPDAEPSR